MKAPSSIEYAVGEPMPGTKWVVRGKLGQGGMGLVLSVEKAGLIRGAMKVLLPSFAKLPEFAAEVPRGGQGHLAPSAPEHRAGARLRSARGRDAVHGDGAPARADAPRGASRDAPAREALDRGEHLRGGGSGRRGPLPRPLARAVDRAQGRQAREHLSPPQRGVPRLGREGDGLRRRRRRGRARSAEHRHAALHGARANGRRGGVAADRSVRPGARRLRDADRPAALGREPARPQGARRGPSARRPRRRPRSSARGFRRAWMRPLLKALSKDPARAARHAARADVRAPGAAVDWRSPRHGGRREHDRSGTARRGRRRSRRARRVRDGRALGLVGAAHVAPGRRSRPAGEAAVRGQRPRRPDRKRVAHHGGSGGGLGRPRARGPACTRYADDRRVRPGPRATDPEQGRAREDGPRAGAAPARWSCCSSARGSLAPRASRRPAGCKSSTTGARAPHPRRATWSSGLSRRVPSPRRSTCQGRQRTRSRCQRWQRPPSRTS